VSISAVLFDVDGTLVDSNYHHTLAWSRALASHGQHPGLAAVHRRIGMGGSELLEALTGSPSDDIERAWRASFDELLPEVSAFRSARDLLEALHGRGVTIVLATSSPEDLLDMMRKKLDADDFIDDVVTSADSDNAKPHPDIFTIALRRSGCPRDRTVAVGDSVWDVAACARAELRCIGVESGGYSRAELMDAGAISVYPDPHALLENIDDWTASPRPRPTPER
jgi:HAD superfamily hydrolase (TIGR01509 family)